MKAHPALLVGIGGAIGTTVRYLLSELIPDVAGVPLSILLLNLSGAFLLGWLLTAITARGEEGERSAQTRLFLGTGVLGGYTTYSTLAFGSAALSSSGAVALGIAYAAATVVLGVICALAGIVLGRRFPMVRAR